MIKKKEVPKYVEPPNPKHSWAKSLNHDKNCLKTNIRVKKNNFMMENQDHQDSKVSMHIDRFFNIEVKQNGIKANLDVPYLNKSHT